MGTQWFISINTNFMYFFNYNKCGCIMNCLDNLDKCKASCCKLLGFGIINPTQERIHYYETHGCKVVRHNRSQYEVLVPFQCPQLDDTNRCKLHGTDKKPKMCCRFDSENTTGFIITEGCIINGNAK